MNKDGLGNRMKGYEDISRIYLTKRTPVIIRIDGRAFHTFTKGFEKPFDEIFMSAMYKTAQKLCENISGCKLAYVQSDEISLLLTDYDTKETKPWFDNNLQKLVSISASMATMYFNKLFVKIYEDYMEYTWNISEKEQKINNARMNAIDKGAMFDARAFILPKEEVCNYFIWRQQDATRNSIQMVGQANFSHKQLQGWSCDVIQDKLFTEKGINWNNLETFKKRGVCVKRIEVEINDTVRHKWCVDMDIPIFTQDREYIEKFI